MQNKVIPAILESHGEDLKHKLTLAASFAPVIHIDMIDENFAEQIVLPDPDILSQFSQQTFLELHMMVRNPHTYIEKYARVGVQRFIGHVEHEESIEKFVNSCQQIQKEAYLGFDLSTPVNPYLSYFSSLPLTGATVLCVHAGKSGQAFDSAAVEKIRILRTHCTDIDIEVDGGINPTTLPLTQQVGANHFAVTSDLFSKEDVEAEYRSLQKLISQSPTE
jgi:ribulose-phosphate 3-epimerase